LPRAFHSHRLEPHYAWIAAGIAVVILYGSFSPFHFYAHQDPRGPLGVLLASGLRPYSRDDVVANVLLYLPLGFFAALALQKRSLSVLAAATAAGFTLSALVELFQYYDMGRYQELTDICSNTFGTLVGALLGGFAADAARRRVASPYLAMMLACWLGFRWYPGNPPVVNVRMGAFLVGSSIPPLDLLRFLAAWLAVGAMLESLSGGSRIALPVLLVVSLLMRAWAVDVEPAEILAGAAAAALWSGLLWRLPNRAAIVAAVFVVSVAVLALAPFHFSATARAFTWAPFRNFIQAGTDNGMRSFFEKAFVYGAMVWLLVSAGLSTGAATAFGATLVFGLRLLQVYLPGRSAEITDTVMVLILAAMMKLVSLANPRPAMASAAGPSSSRADIL